MMLYLCSFLPDEFYPPTLMNLMDRSEEEFDIREVVFSTWGGISVGVQMALLGYFVEDYAVSGQYMYKECMKPGGFGTGPSPWRREEVTPDPRPITINLHSLRSFLDAAAVVQPQGGMVAGPLTARPRRTE